MFIRCAALDAAVVAWPAGQPEEHGAEGQQARQRAHVRHPESHTAGAFLPAQKLERCKTVITEAR